MTLTESKEMWFARCRVCSSQAVPYATAQLGRSHRPSFRSKTVMRPKPGAFLELSFGYLACGFDGFAGLILWNLSPNPRIRTYNKDRS